MCRGFFARFSKPDATNQRVWGFRDYRVFGRDCQFGLIAAGNSETQTVSGSPHTYEVQIPFWCEGVRSNGASVHLQRQLCIEYEFLNDDYEARMLGYEFRDDAELSANPVPIVHGSFGARSTPC